MLHPAARQTAELISTGQVICKEHTEFIIIDKRT
jgi:hypothetical protein